MHHAIEYQHFSTSTLQVGPRKRSPMGQLLRVTQGAALLKLGAHELLLTPGSHFWLCADALAAFTTATFEAAATLFGPGENIFVVIRRTAQLPDAAPSWPGTARIPGACTGAQPGFAHR